MSLIAHTQNFSTLTKNQALTILSQNNGTSTVIPGVDARLLKFLLTAQINAIWNGQDRSAALGGQLGTGVYVGTNLTVNQILHQAFVNGVTNKKFTSADETYVLYLGASGEGQSASACKVQPPPPCVAPPQTASLGDFVWEDKNGNGIQDSGEPGIAGVTVKLLGSDGTTVLKTATTDANGKYLFSNLAAGTYYVQFTTPSGYTFTTANAGSDDGKDSDANATTGKTGAYTLTAGQTNLTVDAGLKATPPPSAPGTGTPGYWMNHPNAWPVAQITIGGKTYPRDQAISLMKAPTAGDVTYTMFQALVSAKLNGLVGNNTTCVDKTIADADAWMAKYPLASGVSGSSDAWKVGEPLYKTLDDYNNGRLCAPHRN